MSASEGSVAAGPGSAAVSGWKNLSEATYATNVRNTLTGAKRLDLPLVSQGAQPIDLIRRPLLGSNEDTTNAVVYGQRYFGQASLRILLSDRQADLTGLPTITGGAPLGLDPAAANPFTPAANMPPIAKSTGDFTATFSATGGTGSSGTGTLTFAGTAPTVPIWLRAGGIAVFPSMTFGGVTVSGCTGMTATTLTGCTTTGVTPTNTYATAPTTLDPSIGGGSVLMRTSGSASSGTNPNRTVPVVSTRDLALGSRLIWHGNTPITCSGYTPTQLTGCYWTTVPNTAIPLRTNVLSGTGQSLLGGYIKIERQTFTGPTTPPVWADVTAEILNLGFSAPNQEGTSAPCVDPTPNAVIRLQRLRDNGTPTAACTYSGATPSLLATDYWPNMLYDAREGIYRDVATTTAMTMGGLMNYVMIDMANLKRWLNGTIGTTGTQALNNNGYIIYFSDRRGNHDPLSPIAANAETGEYGHEDSINQSAGAAWPAMPNAGMPEGGEDRNEDGTLQTYGATVSTVAGVVPGGTPQAPFNLTGRPWSTLTNPQGRVNRQVLFRRALKLWNGGINGGVNNLPDAGILIASENGVYVHGNFNATSTNVEAEPNRPAAILGDAITILSNNWRDVRSLNSPNDMAARDATDTGYRFAMIGGKSVAFTRPGWAAAGDTGTDGGVHNFMRMLEDWGGQTTYYRGSMVSLYTARQMIGIYKANSNTYAPGTREFAFDTDFLQPTLLPPGTPMFRDINTLRFRQILRPNQ
jgi:hypothetical protein